MKSFLAKAYKFLFYLVVVFIVLLAIAQGIARALSPSVNRYLPQVENWLGKVVHQPVHINQIKATWKGFYPVITLNNVVIFDRANTKPLIEVKQFQVNIDILKSLIHWQIEPKMLKVTDTQLVVHQLENGLYDVNGISVHWDENSTQSTTETIQDLLLWLGDQGQISLENVRLDWHDKNGWALPITDLQLQFNKGFIRHQLLGMAKIGGDDPETRIRFVMNLSGGNFKEPLKMQLFIHAIHLNMQRWLHKFQWHDLALLEGQLDDIRIWANWQDTQFNTIQTSAEAHDIKLHRSSANKQLSIQHFKSNLYWENNLSDWNLTGDITELRINERDLQPVQFDLSRMLDQEGRVRKQVFHMNYLLLNNAAEFLENTDLISEDLWQYWSNLQPTGVLKNLVITQEAKFDNQDANFSAVSNFENMNWRHWQTIPGVKNLQGQIKVSPKFAHVELASENTVLDFGKLFRKPLALNSFTGNLYWQKSEKDWILSAQDIMANDDNIGLRADMELVKQSDQKSPSINFLASVSEHDISQAANYTPVGIFHTRLIQWLNQAFKKGEGFDGTVVLQGSLHDFPFDENSGKFEMLLHPQHVDFSYMPNWPLLTDATATLVFDNRSLDITLERGKMMGADIQQAHGSIANLRKAELQIQAKMNTSLNNGLRFIEESPLKKHFSGFEYLNLAGLMKLDLQLQIPFVPKANIHVLGNMDILPDALLAVPKWDFELKQVQGQVQFTENSLSGQNLQAKFLDLPVNFEIDTQHRSNQTHIINVALLGHMPLDVLRKKYNANFWQYVNGTAPYKATLQLTAQKQSHPVLKLDSDLTGININLPAPFKKTEKQIAPFHAEMSFADANIMKLFFSYAKQLSGALIFQQQKEKFVLNGGELHFDQSPATFPTTPGLIVNGHLEQLDFAEIQPFLANFIKNKDEDPVDDLDDDKQLLRLFDVNINDLKIYNINLKQAQLQVQPRENAWSIQINSPTIVGELLIPEDYRHVPIKGEFQRFYFTPMATESVKRINPGNIPSLNLLFRNFKYGNKQFGEVSLLTTSQKNTMVIDKLTMLQPTMKLSATGQWKQVGARQQTSINGSINSTNMGNVLKNWDMTSSLIRGHGESRFQLSWPDAAYAPKVGKLSGNLTMDFKNGRIINIGQGAETEMGLGRVLNLLSLQTLPRRLSLDFSDLTQKGFSFDTMSGSFTFTEGSADTDKFTLNGPVAKVQIKGRIGLMNKDYDLNMLITPYVTSSLPVIATIAINPVAGAAVWVANKILGSTVSKISSHNYRITGPWENPVVAKEGA